MFLQFHYNKKKKGERATKKNVPVDQKKPSFHEKFLVIIKFRFEWAGMDAFLENLTNQQMQHKGNSSDINTV